ncbi:MAG: Eco57I restriction-modification methylase domain-containing protein [Betaproteobacteria bacterium]|nr:Eco57I restriction-modification methylase domain-containing protein [Betaproteobacteria bacterium]
MAGLFPASSGECRLLDAGAGIGSLSSAFLERCITGHLNFTEIQLKAFELDDSIHDELQNSLSPYIQKCRFSFEVIGNDFIEEAVNAIQFQKYNFTHAILNPPYKKIGSNSSYRMLLRETGIETVNLYSAFVALAVAMAAPGGQIVAIIPRSFCNGPYYRPFRDFILERAAIRHMHLFESRSKAFKDDDVLQENIIIRLERGGQQGPVTVSTSTDDSFSDLEIHEHPFDRIVFPDDSERFIHVPALAEKSIELSPVIRHALIDLGIKVSTGPVVDFRLKEHLLDMPESGTVPLLYPGHFSNSTTTWPQAGMKKPNAIQRNGETEKWLYPSGFYCVVRRFSSKEEKRRVVAGVVDPGAFDDAPMLGFENHLNLFHENKRGLPQALARGLAVFLNSTVVDDNFRRFSGHTQVNATDLKQMKYPSRDALIELGEWAMQHGDLTQTMIDNKLGTLTA